MSSSWLNYVLKISNSYHKDLVVGVKFSHYGSEGRRAFTINSGRYTSVDIDNSEYSIDFVELLPEI